MRHYIGTKIIQAEPEVREGNAGYAVVYEDGYRSWSPAEAFEKAYVDLGELGDIPPFHQRLIGEMRELEDRLGKLRELDNNAEHFEKVISDPTARNLLMTQESAMAIYLNTLRRRVQLLEQK